MNLKEQLKEWIEEYLKGTDYELITLNVSAGNDILVEVDRLAGVDVDFCAELNRFLVEKIEDRFADGTQTELDYSLEVGSVSLTDPFKTKMQFEKNLGHDVEVMISTKDSLCRWMKRHLAWTARRKLRPPSIPPWRGEGKPSDPRNKS